MNVSWSPLALKRIGEIASYIAQDKQDAAKKWTIAVFTRTDKLKRFPKSGRQVPESDHPSVREIIFGQYRIVYRIKSNRIEVMTVRHGKQKALFDEITRAESIRVPDDPMRGPIS